MTNHLQKNKRISDLHGAYTASWRFFMKIKHQKLKSAGAFLTILLLLPYVVTVFVNGIDVLGMSQEPCVQAETEDQDGEKTVRTVPWTEYMMGILGKTMPASYEKEALKAQAVVLRTMPS
jgi:stage II sporulation protein D